MLSTRRPGLLAVTSVGLCFKIPSSPKSFIWNISINKFHQEQKFFICAPGYEMILSHTISYSLFQQGLSVLICEVPGSQIWLKCSIYAHWIKEMLQKVHKNLADVSKVLQAGRLRSEGKRSIHTFVLFFLFPFLLKNQKSCAFRKQKRKNSKILSDL